MAAIKRKRAIEPLTIQEFHGLIDAARWTTGGARDRALLALLGGSGLRLNEALSLEVRDVDDRGRINVRKGKGAKQRQVAVPGSMFVHVSAWLRVRADLGIGAGYLLCGYSKGSLCKPMRQPHIARTLKRLAKRSGLDKRVHPHGLRHSFTKWLAESGAPIHSIKNALGHSSLATTDLYLSIISPQDVFDAIEKLDL